MENRRTNAVDEGFTDIIKALYAKYRRFVALPSNKLANDGEKREISDKNSRQKLTIEILDSVYSMSEYVRGMQTFVNKDEFAKAQHSAASKWALAVKDDALVAFISFRDITVGDRDVAQITGMSADDSVLARLVDEILKTRMAVVAWDMDVGHVAVASLHSARDFESTYTKRGTAYVRYGSISISEKNAVREWILKR